MHKAVRHLPHYISLVGILAVAFAGLVLFPHDKYFQLSVAIALAVSYVSWGIVHHIIHKDFHLEVLLEYLAVAVLGLTILLSLVIRT